MTAYTVHFTSLASAWATVEAESPEAAVDLAYNEVHVSLCHQCGRDVELGGEWEAIMAFDDDAGKPVWEAEE